MTELKSPAVRLEAVIPLKPEPSVEQLRLPLAAMELAKAPAAQSVGLAARVLAVVAAIVPEPEVVRLPPLPITSVLVFVPELIWSKEAPPLPELSGAHFQTSLVSSHFRIWPSLHP